MQAGLSILPPSEENEVARVEVPFSALQAFYLGESYALTTRLSSKGLRRLAIYPITTAERKETRPKGKLLWIGSKKISKEEESGMVTAVLPLELGSIIVGYGV